MGIYQNVYNFAAKAGSLEGYVYPKDLDLQYLPQWADNMVSLYHSLPSEVREEIQAECNETIGRTIQSLLPLLGEGHEVIKKLRSLAKGNLPSSPNDFPYRRKVGNP